MAAMTIPASPAGRTAKAELRMQNAIYPIKIKFKIQQPNSK